VLAVLLAVALFFSIRADRRPAAASTPSTKLPLGAEAAIWSILEAVPDPRNHLALTRDLTGEVRIAGTPLDPAFRASLQAAAATSTAAPTPTPGLPSTATGPQPAVAPVPVELWDSDPFPPLRISDEPLDLRTFERAS
jgi:hypothetical protein